MFTDTYESRAFFLVPTNETPTPVPGRECYRAGSRRDVGLSGKQRRLSKARIRPTGVPAGERLIQSGQDGPYFLPEKEGRLSSLPYRGKSFRRKGLSPPEGRLGIKDWPESERPRERLLRKGSTALSDAELVALFVRSGTRGRTAVDLARAAIASAGSLRELLALDFEDLCKLPGFGPARYVELQACLEIGRRYLAAQLDRGKPLASPDDTSRFLMAKLRHHPFEVFCCLFLDNRHRVIEFEELFRGTIDGTSVHPREVVRRALNHNAAAVIFAHNHPSGVAEPSQADEILTDQLVNALTVIEVRVLDHLVVGDGECVSFADRGLI